MKSDSELTIAILGGGSFGTAIANIIAANNNTTYLWMRDSQRAAKCQAERENSEYLPDYPLVEKLIITSDLQEAVGNADVIFISVPSKSVREVAKRIAPLIKPGVFIVSTTKGVEPGGFTLMSSILEEELSDVVVGVLSGPNFAKEIVQNKHSGTVVACENEALVACIQRILSSETFRVYANHDRFGVELAGALKNIYAIITGMAAALDTGHNTMAMLLTRSLAEMGRFASALGANPMTFLGLAGVGDLILTCTSDLSRNYRVGYALGKGQSLESIVAEIGQVVEGLNTVKLVKEKADELGVYMPLVSGLYAVLYQGRSMVDAAKMLMQGEQNTDVEYSGGK